MSNKHAAYWRANLRVVTGCLIVWGTVSFGGGILFVEFFNQFHLAGYPLGFWFAQQGSLFTFLLLIFYYAFRMNRLDHQYGVEED